MREFGEIEAEALTRGVPLRFSYHSFEQMRVKDAPNPKFKSLVGSVVADLARGRQGSFRLGVRSCDAAPA